MGSVANDYTKMKELYGADFVKLCKSAKLNYYVVKDGASILGAVNSIFTPSKQVFGYLDGLESDFKQTLIGILFNIQPEKRNEFVEKFISKNPNFVVSTNGRLSKYNYRKGNTYFCDNDVVVDDGEVIEYNSNRFVFADNYVFDMRDRIVYPYNEKEDAFSKSFGEIKRIDTMVAGDKTTINVTPKVGEIVVVKTRNNLIEEYSNNNITELENGFLAKGEALRKISTPSVKKVGNSCLKYSKKLEELNMPSLETAGDHFLTFNRNLKEADLPNLKSVGMSFLLLNKELKKLNVPNLESSKGEMLAINKDIENINAPKFIDYGENINKKIRALAERNVGLGL